MSEQHFNLPDIIALMEAFQKNNMGALKLKNGDQELSLKSRELPSATTPMPAAATQVTAVVQNNIVEDAEPAISGTVVTSPIVGTFYAAPAPDKAPFVKVGDRVKKGDVLFIIESMKLMNEVLSEHDGTVSKFLVEDGQAVEYGQPILCIE